MPHAQNPLVATPTDTPKRFMLELDLCDFFAAVQFMKELSRLMAEHGLDTVQEPQATLRVGVGAVTPEAQAALQGFLEEASLLKMPLTAQVY